MTDRREHYRRTLEVASIRYGNEEAEQYCNVLHSVLAISSDGSIDEALIRMVVRHLRAASCTYSLQGFLYILQEQYKEEVQVSPTLALLCASLACELDGKLSKRDILTHMAAMLVHFNGQAALSEALLIGMIKVAMCCSEGAPDIASCLSKVGKGDQHSMLQHRLDQLREVLQDGKLPEATQFPNGNLLDTVDRVDAYFAKSITLPDVVKHAAAAPSHHPKPLHYEPYSESATLSPSSSSSANKSFLALPPPSLAPDGRTRRQRKQKEDEVRLEMQKSIAKLTLGADDDSVDEEQEKIVDAAKDGVLI